MKDALQRALKSDDVDTLAELIEQGLELDGEGRPPLVSASLSKAKKCMALLLAKGADVDGCGSFHDTPLLMAQDAKSVKILVDAGADVELCNSMTKTPPLVHAAAVRGAPVIKALLDAGADPNACTSKSAWELCALEVAVQKERAAGVVKALMRKPPTSDRVAKAIGFALGRCKEDGLPPKHAKILDAILAARPKLDGVVSVDQGREWPVLHLAVERGTAPIVQQLIDAGADPDARGTGDVTAVFLAASRGLALSSKRAHYQKIVQVLVDAGADLDVVCSADTEKQHDGKTARQLLEQAT